MNPVSRASKSRSGMPSTRQGQPKPIIHTLTKAFQAALKDKIVKERFADLGTEPVTEKRATPEALRGHLKTEIDSGCRSLRRPGSTPIKVKMKSESQRGRVFPAFFLVMAFCNEAVDRRNGLNA